MEKHAREAAERVAESCKSALDKCMRKDEDSFEAVLVQDMVAMRDAYEAKIAAVLSAAREESTGQRRVSHSLHDWHLAGSTRLPSSKSLTSFHLFVFNATSTA